MPCSYTYKLNQIILDMIDHSIRLSSKLPFQLLPLSLHMNFWLQAWTLVMHALPLFLLKVLNGFPLFFGNWLAKIN